MFDYTKWKRINLESPGQRSLTETDPERRRQCEEDTNKDLRKPIQQLICDVHEEASDPDRSLELSQLLATRRMVSMMGRVALEHERSSKILVRLTWVLVILTISILVLTGIILAKTFCP
ncbi:MAG: hypothetical protein ABSE05_17095 [Syntrophales bacterium]|jgi:hypothetical protein